MPRYTIQSVIVAAAAGLWLVGPGAVPGLAQGILNAERLQPREVDGAHFGAEIGVDVSAGNTEVVDIEATGSAGYQSEAHWIRLLGGVELLSEEGTDIEDNRFGHLRYNYRLADRVRSFHFVQLQTAENLRLRRRFLVGSGLRSRLLAGQRLLFDLGCGLMYEYERLNEARLGADEDVTVDDVRVTSLAVLQIQLRQGVEFQNVIYLQPALDDLGDFRVLSDASLLVELVGNFGLRVALRWRHDSRPPASVERDDLNVTTSLSLNYP